MSLINQFMPFAQEKIGFDEPPRLFLKNDEKNAKNPLGKTAYYDPQEKSVTLYVTGRHPKDILRSLGHELVHHKQNCDGKFDNVGDMGEGYAQSNPHLRQMEFEANSVGSMCLRDFEDGLKKENTIYYEHLQKGETKMSTKDWKNKEITQLLSEAWGFKFNTLEEFDEFNGEGELQAEEAEVQEEADILEVSDQEGKKDAEMETKGDATDETENEELEEVAASSGRQSPHADRRGDDERKRPMEEAEELEEGEMPDGLKKHLDKQKGEDGDDSEKDKEDIEEGQVNEEEIEELARATSHDRRTPHKSAKYKDEEDEAEAKNEHNELTEAIKTILSKYIKG